MKYLSKVYLICCATLLAMTTVTACNYVGGDLKTEKIDGTGATYEPCTTYTGSEILSWEPPSTYANGTPLAQGDITGYHLYYGMSSGTYTMGNHLITDPSATSIGIISVVTVTTGRYYFVITAINLIDGESGRSNEACLISNN